MLKGKELRQPLVHKQVEAVLEVDGDDQQSMRPLVFKFSFGAKREITETQSGQGGWGRTKKKSGENGKARWRPCSRTPILTGPSFCRR